MPPPSMSLPLEMLGTSGDDSKLFWSRESDLSDQIFPDSAPALYIFLVKSTVVGRNMGKYDFIAITDTICEVIDGELAKLPKQCKIICEVEKNANLLIRYNDLED